MIKLFIRILVIVLFAALGVVMPQQAALGADYYWVGNSGAWHEAETHWATTSGGDVFHAQPPTKDDDVFFDANSFTRPGQIVSVYFDPVECRNMDWSGVTNDPVFQNLYVNNLNIYGSVVMPPQVTVVYAGEVIFRSAASGNTIVWQPAYADGMVSVNFNGTGDWTLAGDLTALSVRLEAGTLNTSGFTVTSEYFNVSGTDPKTLNLSTSEIVTPNWTSSSDPAFTLNAGTSTIYTSGTFTARGSAYHNVVLDDPGDWVSLGESGTYNRLTITPGTAVIVQAFSTHTFNELAISGTVEQIVRIKGQFDNQVNFIKATPGDLTVHNVALGDNNIQGTGIFTALNSTDLGNNNGWVIPFAEPVRQPLNARITRDGPSLLDVAWDYGSGTGSIILARKGMPVDAVPADNVVYTGHAVFGNGDEIGTGNFVVHTGAEELVNVRGLEPGTEYHFAIFSYSDKEGTIDYKQTGPARVSWRTFPTNQFIMDGTAVIEVCDGRIFDSGGHFNYLGENYVQTLVPETAGAKIRLNFSDFRTYLCCNKLNIYDGPDTGAPLLGTYTNSSLPPTLTATNASGQLTLEFTGIHPATESGWEAIVSCYTEGVVPAVPSSGITFRHVVETTMDVAWTPGNGAARLVVAKAGSPVDVLPAGATAYTVNAGFGAGEDLGNGNFAVYQGPGSSFTLEGLEAGETYHLAVFELNGDGVNTQYMIAEFATGSAATIPTVVISNTPVTACSGNYTDSGGVNGDYSSNEDFVQTIAPSEPGRAVQLTFTMFELEFYDEYLWIYDGPDTNGERIGLGTQTDVPRTFTATNPDGVLTVAFRSNEEFERAGWLAKIGCAGEEPSKLPQTITFQSIPDKAEGDAPFVVDATASSGLDVTVAVVAGPAMIAGSQITLTGFGRVTVNASQPGNETYEAAEEVTTSFCVIPSTPAIALDDTEPGVYVLTSSRPVGNQWYKNGEPVAGATAQALTVTEGAAYTVRIINSGGCPNSDLSEPANILITGTDPETARELVLYPNPADDKIVISLPGRTRVWLSLYSADGRRLRSETLSLEDGRAILDTVGLPPGVYMLQLMTNGVAVHEKLIKR